MQPLHAPTAEDFAFSRLISYAAYQWPGYRDAAHHRLIARHLEAVERGDIKRLMITMPPRHGKSMLASEFFPAWYIGRNPDHYVVTATYAQDLADDFGRKVKNQIEDDSYKAIFPGVGLSDDSKSAKRFHIDGNTGGIEHSTSQRGAYYAVGVGGPLTGRGAHLLLIDDPVKNREDAESEVIRKKTKDWYTSTAYTRLMPGGRIIIIQCMVGDTRVLMSDGSEKMLRDVRAGDRVATYDDGKISTSKVLNWTNQGPDRIIAIKMSSGIVVRANERHPFLVANSGDPEWKRVNQLEIGEKVVRAIGVSGEASLAATKDAANRQSPEGSVLHTTIRFDGKTANVHHQSMPSLDEQLTSSIGTVSQQTTTIECSQSKMGVVQSVENFLEPTCERIGAESFASITATTPIRFEDCSAMTATLQSDMARQKTFSCEQLNTFEITHDEIVDIYEDGYEDVFDIEVERTHNFIANGLVSHNTRWHEDDLAGWLQAEHEHEGWVVLNLPAINDAGEALWPEQYDITALEQIKRALPPRDWSALYQQAPSPETGDYFKREWLHLVDHLPPRETMLVYGGSDYAVTSNGGDYTVHGVIGLDPEGNPWLLDLWRQQASSDVWVEAFCDLVLKHKPIGWAEETGQIKSGVGPFLVKRMLERQAYVAREQFATRGDKAVRAQSFRGLIATRGLRIPKDAPWVSALISEMMTFPVGVHDDQVDTLGLIGQLIDRMSAGSNMKTIQPAHVMHTTGDIIAPKLNMTGKGRR